MIAYRKATLDDLEELLHMRITFLCEGRSIPEGQRNELTQNNRRYLQDALSEGSFLAWMAEEEGHVVGISGLSLYRFPPNPACPDGMTGYISNMYTVPSHRGNGIATQLFSRLLEEARAHGCGKLLLTATDMGRPLYEKFGFRDPGTWMALQPVNTPGE